MSQPCWQLKAWTNDAKSSLVTTTNSVEEVDYVQALMQPSTCRITLFLGDKNTSGIGKGYWVELSAGLVSYSLIFSGYVTAITKDDSAEATIVLDCADPSYILAKKRNLGALLMQPSAGYTDIGKVLNGQAVQPGKFGILNEFGWNAEYLDGQNAHATGKKVGAVAGTIGAVSSTGSQTVTYSGPGLNVGSVVTIDADTASEEVTAVTVTTSSTFTAVFANTHAANTPYHLFVDIYSGDWDSASGNLTNVCQQNVLYWRPKQGTNTKTSGTVQYGPLQDDSGLTIWGARPLRDDLVANHGYSSGEQLPDAGLAQRYGYAVIERVERQDNWAQLSNLVFPIGHGLPEATSGTTLHGIDDSTPADAAGNAINGWTKLSVPPAIAGGRTYYTKPQSKTTYDGQSYVLVACAEQDTTSDNAYSFAIGLMDTTSATSYDIHEAFLKERLTKDPQLLLSQAMGDLMFNADPVPSWTFTVLHPLTSTNHVPTIPQPGQLLTVNYAGVLDHAETWNDSTQTWQDAGSLIYAKFPSFAGDTDENGVTWTANRYNKLRRLVRIETVWAADGTVRQILTCGLGKWHSGFVAEQLAKRMAKADHSHQSRKHTVHKFSIDGIPFIGLLGASEDVSNGTWKLPPGGMYISDTRNVRFFDDHHRVEFTLKVTDDTQVCEFLFCKPANLGTLQQMNAGATYGVLRLAFTNSTKASGIFTTSDGITFTAQGSIKTGGALDSNKRLAAGTVRVSFGWESGHYDAWVSYLDSDTADATQVEATIATWNDVGASGSQVLNGYGAIGWHAFNGTGSSTAAMTLSAVHAHPSYRGQITRAQHHPHHPGTHQWLNIRFPVTAWDGTNATVLPHVTHNPAHLVSHDGSILTNADGTKIEWTASPAAITGMTQGTSGKPWLVYNSESYSISDGTNSVASKSFGALQLTKTGKHSWDGVFVVGCLSDTVDKHTKRPWISGFQPSAHPAAGYQQAKRSSGRGADHPHKPHKKKRRMLSLPTGGGGGGGSIAKAL